MDVRGGAAVLAMLASLCSLTAWGQFTIYPSQPRLGETVRLQIPSGSFGTSSDVWDVRGNRVTMTGNRITVGLVNRGMGTELPNQSPRFDVPMGQFPEGTYQVDVQIETLDRAIIRNLGSTSFSVAPRAYSDPLWNLTDLWWNPAEPGWGINLVQHPSGVLFATWFVYASDGRATWYVVPDARPIGLGSGFRGQIYRTTGPAFCPDNGQCLGLPFDPAAVSVFPVGQAVISISPSDFDQAMISITVDGATVSRFVRRQGF